MIPKLTQAELVKNASNELLGFIRSNFRAAKKLDGSPMKPIRPRNHPSPLGVNIPLNDTHSHIYGFIAKKTMGGGSAFIGIPSSKSEIAIQQNAAYRGRAFLPDESTPLPDSVARDTMKTVLTTIDEIFKRGR